MVHALLAHPAVACGSVHAVPHAPQSVGVLVVSVSQPSEATLLQSPHPDAQEATVHALLAHPAVACASVQTVPQAPQFVGLVVVFVSQPFDVVPSQLPHPVEQDAIVHALLTHVSLALGRLQTVPHAPQFVALLVVLVSQPSDVTLLQLPHPNKHDAMVHALLAQPSLALARLHTWPHDPQLLTLVLVSTSQPLAVTPSQLPHPGRHEATVQALLTQLSLALGRSQAWPHDPQLLTLLLVSISQPSDATPLQLAQPDEHDTTVQALLAQPSLAFGRLQAWPHEPQSLTVLVVSTSQPSDATPLQLPHPDAQDATVQALLAQPSLAWGRLQTAPQAPQLLTSVRVSISQPVSTFPSQSARPVLHAILHWPATQLAVPPVELHTCPQLPQLFTSPIKSTSQPSASLSALQSAKPVSQSPVQTPAVQTVVGTLLVLHALPQPPQFSGSDAISTSQPSSPLPGCGPLQSAQPLSHAFTHKPSWHAVFVECVVAQAPPHEPQCCALVEMFVSQPLPSTLSQLPKEASHCAIAHVPPAHVAAAWFLEHAMPHAPQSISVVRSTSHPFASSLSQSAVNGAVQIETLHSPVAHVYTSGPGPPQYAAVHEPQCSSVCRFTSQPFESTPSQSAHPLLHCVMTQEPVVQSADAFSREHVCPHCPQSSSVLIGVSHPFAGFESQSAYIASHAPSAHAPFRQITSALAYSGHGSHSSEFGEHPMMNGSG